MALFLVQHGKSLPKELDPGRGLSEQGISDVNRIAGVARGYKVRVARIVHSGKRRAQQTADIIASSLEPEGGVNETSGLNPLDDAAAFAGTLNSRDDLMVVGHLPFLEKLVSFLITGTTDNPVFKFQNGGIVCMDEDPERNGWVIKWTLMPEIG